MLQSSLTRSSASAMRTTRRRSPIGALRPSPLASTAARGLVVAAAATKPNGSPSASSPGLASAAASAAAALLLLTAAPLTAPPPAAAAGGEKLGEFAASGLLFKDSVEVSALSDRDLPGVTVYISDFKRSITDKLSKDFFAEPSQASITCALDPAAAAALAAEPTSALEKRLGGAGGEGKEVFAERKGLNVFKNKTLRVRRLFDSDRRASIYVAYSTRLGTAGDEGNGVSTGRYRTSICAVPLPAYTGGAEQPGAPTVAE